MKWINSLLLIACASFASACLPVTNDALWKDIAKRPPDAMPETVAAIANDAPFASWVIYMDRACDEFGCAQ